MSCTTPQSQNYCLQEEYPLEGACIPVVNTTSTNLKAAQQNTIYYCQQGLPDNQAEWTYKGKNSSTKYCTASQSVDPSLAGRDCPSSATGVVPICERVRYTGDPMNCCFQDYAYNNCSQTDDSCFSKDKTCAPENRNILSDNCREVVVRYCTGQDLEAGDSSWIYRWMNILGAPKAREYSESNPGGDPKEGVCMYYVRRELFTDNNSTGNNNCLVPNPVNGSCGEPLPVPYRSAGYNHVQNLISRVFLRYNQDGYRIGSRPGERGYSDFQEFLYRYICCAYPGLCTQALTTICPAHSALQLSRNPVLSQWCGCYLNNTEYAKYVNEYQVNKQCSPMCNRSGVLPIVDGSGRPIRCDQNVCVIDDITLNIVDSNLSGGISFANICGNCGTGNDGSQSNCSCIVSGVEIDVLNSSVGNVFLQQNCSNQNCNVKNTTGVGPSTIPVACADVSNDPIASSQNNWINSKNSSYILTIGIIFAIILIGAIICLILYRRKE